MRRKSYEYSEKVYNKLKMLVQQAACVEPIAPDWLLTLRLTPQNPMNFLKFEMKASTSVQLNCCVACCLVEVH